MAKKEFEWKSQQQIGMVEQNEKKRNLVSFCSLDVEVDEETEERWYISIQTMQYFKKKGQDDPTWHITKNATFPLDTWMEIKQLVDDNVEYE